MLECSYCVHTNRNELRYEGNCLGLSLHAPHKQQKLGTRGCEGGETKESARDTHNAIKKVGTEEESLQGPTRAYGLEPICRVRTYG